MQTLIIFYFQQLCTSKPSPKKRDEREREEGERKRERGGRERKREGSGHEKRGGQIKVTWSNMSDVIKFETVPRRRRRRRRRNHG